MSNATLYLITDQREGNGPTQTSLFPPQTVWNVSYGFLYSKKNKTGQLKDFVG